MKRLYSVVAMWSIYFVMLPVIICYTHIDGRIQAEIVFQAFAWYSLLIRAVLLDCSDGIVFGSQAIVTCMRIKVPIYVKCNVLYSNSVQCLT